MAAIFSSLLITFLAISLNFNLSFAHYTPAVHVDHGHDHHHCDHGHDHHHGVKKLPEELAEEEDLRLLEFGSHHHHHPHPHHHDHDHLHGPLELSGVEECRGGPRRGRWPLSVVVMALGSCNGLLIIGQLGLPNLPDFVAFDIFKRKTIKNICRCTGCIWGVIFGLNNALYLRLCAGHISRAGAMLGDAFLHQLPHAFGGEHSHSHDSHMDDPHQHVNPGNNHSHAHSLKDLSVGLSILVGIIIFLLVEKIVRYVEHMSGGVHDWTHGHHHHHHKKSENSVDDNDDHDNVQGLSPNEKDGSTSEMPSEEKVSKRVSDDPLHVEKQSESAVLRKRNTSTSAEEHKPSLHTANGPSNKSLVEKGPAQSSSSLVFGYLNLFSDGVHNFTDGMALGSAFLLHGSIGGWSRTLFLLAHELPQEIGDFGILVRSGFSVSKALFFNFLSALMALAGTALALLLGQDPGQSSLIEGFTAGGFIYIAVAGVLAEMNNGSSALRNTAIQLTALVLGMGVALCISLVE